jgi:hypothetical protein
MPTAVSKGIRHRRHRAHPSHTPMTPMAPTPGPCRHAKAHPVTENQTAMQRKLSPECSFAAVWLSAAKCPRAANRSGKPLRLAIAHSRCQPRAILDMPVHGEPAGRAF